MRVSYRETALIAEALAELREAGVPVGRTFDVLLRRGRSRRGRKGLEELRRRVEQGQSFSEGLQAGARRWPRFFVEMVRCSEPAGRLREGLVEAAAHFGEMARVRKAAHMLWIGPVTILAFGSLIRALLWFHFVGAAAGWAFCVRQVSAAAPPAAVILLVLYVPFLRRLLDRAVLHLPLAAETVRDLALYQFTTCFRLLYSGGADAGGIVRLAGNAVGNTFLRRRLSVAGDDVAQGVPFSEALRERILWPGGYMDRFREAEQVGELERTLNELARERRLALEMRVERTRRTIEPLVAYGTSLVIALELYAIFRSLSRG